MWYGTERLQARVSRRLRRMALVPLLVLLVQGASAGPDDRPVTFVEALALMKGRNRELRLAQRDLEAAKALTLSARARPNPDMQMTAGAIRLPGTSWPPGVSSDQRPDTVVQINQLIERGNKRGLRTEASEALLAASRADLSDALRQQTVALAGAYYDLLFSQERVQIAEDTVALLARTVVAAELRLKTGDIAPSDLSRIRVDRLRAENELRQAQADRDRARQALAHLLGIETESARLRASDPWPQAPPWQDPGDVWALADARADVTAARLRLQAAEKARDLAKALRARDVTVGIQYQRYPGQLEHNTVGFSVSLPLFLNYTYEGEIERGEVGVQAGVDLVQRARGTAVTEINGAWVELASARERVRRYEGSLLDESRRASEAAEFAYRNGALGVIDLLDARRVLYATRVEAARAHADLARAIVVWSALTAPYQGTGGE